MTSYRVWISKEEYIDIEAECPSRAIEEAGRRWIWKIGKLEEGGSNGSIRRN